VHVVEGGDHDLFGWRSLAFVALVAGARRSVAHARRFVRIPSPGTAERERQEEGEGREEDAHLPCIIAKRIPCRIQLLVIAVVDNYDSFTYNLVQYLLELGAVVEVHRNDAITVDELVASGPEGLLLSPGPGRPESAGITLDCVARLSGELPIFGVCLGHQSIAQAFGAKVVPADRLMHGRTSAVKHDAAGLFAGLPSPFTATRYHSLIVDRETVPDALVETAWTEEGELMGLRHREHRTFGVQFHPESFLTEHGHALLSNFLSELPERGRRPTERAA